ncbi:MAG: hypothetical protein M1826_003340 [Phylliscum demangeonii]|nr:MAG: hypothetical protein M1826_003340 [Phylliscum demangeonii]
MALSSEGDSAAPPPNMLVLGREGQALDEGVVATTTARAAAKAGRRTRPRCRTTCRAVRPRRRGGSSGCVCVCRHEHSNLSRLKMLILCVAMNIGFQNTSDQTPEVSFCRKPSDSIDVAL